MIKIVLEGESPLSYNKILRMNRFTRNSEAQAVKQLVASHVGEVPMFTEQVDICIIGYYQDRRRDSCNIPAKLYIDGLIGRVIQNDSPVYVRSVTTLSCKGEARVEIYVREVTSDTIQWKV